MVAAVEGTDTAEEGAEGTEAAALAFGVFELGVAPEALKIERNRTAIDRQKCNLDIYCRRDVGANEVSFCLSAISNQQEGKKW
jgi:hypothetical protein